MGKRGVTIFNVYIVHRAVRGDFFLVGRVHLISLLLNVATMYTLCCPLSLHLNNVSLGL